MGTTYARSGAGRLALAVVWLLPLSLVLAGCMVNRSQSVRAVTPPDPPPVPRAKPVAPANWSGQATHYPETGQTAYEPAQSPTPVPAPMPTNGQRVHVITEGQSLYAVARLYGLSTADLIEANQLSPPYKLTLGQRLLVPSAAGKLAAPVPAAPKPVPTQPQAQVQARAPQPAAKEVPVQVPVEAHVVKSGDTVYSIARQYQVDMATLITMNGIPASYFISPGQRLKLPGRQGGDPALAGLSATGGAKLSAAAATGGSQPAAQSTSVAWTQESQSTVAMMPPPEVSGPIPKAPPRASDKFLWPVDGKLVLNYGPKKGGLHNDGINIAAPRGSPVLAAENGVVAYVGNELRGFGNLLLIKHEGGWMTAYAHNEAILVGRGAKVKRGQTVARVGDSGSVVTPQLHFEIRRGTRAVNPSKLLGPRQAAQM